MISKVERHPHILKENKSSTYPRHIIFWDVEATQEACGKRIYHKPFLVVAYRWYNNYRKGKNPTTEWFYSTNPREFWEWVVSKVHRKEALYMFAHNPTYDLVVSQGFPVLREKGFVITRYYEKGRTFILKFQGGGKSIVVLNVGNYFPGSVQQLGEAFGLPKLKVDFNNPTLEEMLPYCRRDVEIISKAILTWIQFCKDNDLGCFGTTAPKQAFNAYRHRFMPTKIYLHADAEAVLLEREAYYGGRAEGFIVNRFIGEKVWMVDVNSMYPAVMWANEFPTKLIAVRYGLSAEGLKRILQDYLVCARVKVRAEKPFLPCRQKMKLIFPVGEFVTTLATPELLLALENGWVEEVYNVAIYQKAPLFRDFVDFFYKARMEAKREGNKVKELLLKLILNSLYGKFGEKAGGWKVIGDAYDEGAGYEEVYDTSEGRWITYKWVNGVLMERAEDKEGYNSFPGIAAHVTSYARVKLLFYILQAGWENVLYCDTDSLIVNEEGYRRLAPFIDEEKLGCLKVEEEGEGVIIFGPKDYVFGGKEKHKGIPKGAKRLTGQKWVYHKWPKLSTLIRKGFVDKYYIEEVVKELKRRYTKGWVLENGKVLPLVVRIEEGENVIVPWQETKYAKEGLRLMNEAQMEWIEEEYGK